MRDFLAAATLVLCMLTASQAAARVERITVHGASLEGNWEGNAPDRKVIVLLPDDYDARPERRYPVVNFLHGFWPGEDYVAWAGLDEGVAAVAAQGDGLILVLHDSQTRQQGSMYSASPAAGDFEGFVARDLVAHIDAHYRTIAMPESRGLAGHSMGGYGTLRIAMKHPGVFSSIYAMSACCTTPATVDSGRLERLAKMTPEQVASASGGDKGTMAILAAWAPSPEAPHFFDHGVIRGGVDPLLLARLSAASLLVMLPQHLRGLEELEAIALDIGTADGLLLGNRALHDEMERFGVEHGYVEYDGDHLNRVKERVRTEVLPFFARHLDRQD